MNQPSASLNGARMLYNHNLLTWQMGMPSCVPLGIVRRTTTYRARLPRQAPVMPVGTSGCSSKVSLHTCMYDAATLYVRTMAAYSYIGEEWAGKDIQAKEVYILTDERVAKAAEEGR